MADIIAVLLILAGCFFFLAGTVGLLRFPDTLTRLHALTKADNLGLGLVAAGLGILAGDLLLGVKLLVIWLATLAGSATVAYLVAGDEASGRGDEP